MGGWRESQVSIWSLFRNRPAKRIGCYFRNITTVSSVSWKEYFFRQVFKVAAINSFCHFFFFFFCPPYGNPVTLPCAWQTPESTCHPLLPGSNLIHASCCYGSCCRKWTDVFTSPRARTPSLMSRVNFACFTWCLVCGVSTSSLQWVRLHSSDNFLVKEMPHIFLKQALTRAH